MIVTITFTVRDPLSVNKLYRGSLESGQRYLTREGKLFKQRVTSAAMIARMGSTWPADPWRVARARLSYELFDYRGDSDGPRKAAKDCMEQILWANDKVVEDGPTALPLRDGGGRRIEFKAELLETRTPEEARKLREEKAARDLASAKRRALRPPKKRPERYKRVLAERDALRLAVSGLRVTLQRLKSAAWRRADPARPEDDLDRAVREAEAKLRETITYGP